MLLTVSNSQAIPSRVWQILNQQSKELLINGFLMDAVEKITAEAWKLPFALRVDSISNFQYSRGIDDDLIVEDLIEGGKKFSQEELDRVKKVALNEPFLINQLINKDATVTGINITFQMPQKSNDEAPIAVGEVRKLVEEIEKSYDVNIHLTGVVVLSNAFFEASMSDMGTLVPAMYLIIVLVTFLLLRSISATFTTFIVIVYIKDIVFPVVFIF